jgi:hypothetical protein
VSSDEAEAAKARGRLSASTMNQALQQDQSTGRRASDSNGAKDNDLRRHLCSVSGLLAVGTLGVGERRGELAWWQQCRIDNPWHIESANDPQVRQSPLQLFHSGVGDLSAIKLEVGEIRQPLQVHQPSVRDLSAVEQKDGEIR